MKSKYILIGGFLLMAPLLRGQTISVEDFQKLGEAERAQVIEKASPAQREKLQQADRHLRVAAQFGGEEHFQWGKTTEFIKEKGLIALDGLFQTQIQLWEQYMGGVLMANEKAGMSIDEQGKAELALRKESDRLMTRYQSLRRLLVRTEPSAAAADLAKDAMTWDTEIRTKYSLGESTPAQRVTKAQMADVNRRMDVIYEKLDKLPIIPDKDFQAEYDRFPDEKVPVPLGR